MDGKFRHKCAPSGIKSQVNHKTSTNIASHLLGAAFQLCQCNSHFYYEGFHYFLLWGVSYGSHRWLLFVEIVKGIFRKTSVPPDSHISYLISQAHLHYERSFLFFTPVFCTITIKKKKKRTIRHVVEGRDPRTDMKGASHSKLIVYYLTMY